MFELLAAFQQLQTQSISWMRDQQHSGCMPTYSNWNCTIKPEPGEYGPYVAIDHKDSSEPPHGDWVYWEHSKCDLDMKGGTCR